MRLDAFTVSWFDLLVVMVVILGIVRGRKRGMSEELLDLLKWIVVLVAAALVCEPLGIMLAQSMVFSLLGCFVAVYTGIIILTRCVCSFIRHRVGDKLVGSDVFGNAEYYLGMVAGAVRYSCILLVVLAFLNARYYSPEEIYANAAYQEANFGMQFIPTMAGLQQEVFQRSCVGSMVRQYLPMVLIRPTAPEDRGLETSNLVRAREQRMNEMLDKR